MHHIKALHRICKELHNLQYTCTLKNYSSQINVIPLCHLTSRLNRPRSAPVPGLRQVFWLPLWRRFSEALVTYLIETGDVMVTGGSIEEQVNRKRSFWPRRRRERGQGRSAGVFRLCEGFSPRLGEGESWVLPHRRYFMLH